MKVFLDMDEVLTDFNKKVYEVFGIPYKYETLSENYNYFSEIGQTRESVSEKCNVAFWKSIEWMHDGIDILCAVLNTFPARANEIYLLSVPMPNLKSYEGKLLWVREHFPILEKRTIIMETPKSLFAGPDTLLIDDKDENIEEFVAAGGQGLLVPRPWNRAHFYADRTLDIVKQFLEDL